MRTRSSIALAAMLATSLSGCALLSKSEPIRPRYFSAEDSVGTPVPARDGTTQRLRLGRVSAGSSLRDRIVYRTGPDEIAFYEDQRWTERPESYLRRALSRALFERRGFSRVVSGAAPTLEAELIAFEEIREPTPRARVTLVFTLDDEKSSLLEQTITVERDVHSAAHEDHAAALAHTVAEALHEAVERVAERVTVALPAAAPPNEVERAGDAAHPEVSDAHE